MNLNQILIVAGVGMVTYYVATRYLGNKNRQAVLSNPARLSSAVATNMGTRAGSQQTQQLIDQCGGWDECLAGLAGV